MLSELPKFTMEIKRDPEKFDYYTAEDEARFVELIKTDGAYSLFLYSRNVLTPNGIRPLDESDRSVRTVAKSGKMYVPVSFFTDFLKADVGACSEKHVPLADTCRRLGIPVGIYNGGLLAVVGGSTVGAEIKKNPRLIYAGGYATLGKYDATRFTSSDYKAAKIKWCENIVGSAEINDMSIPEVKMKVEEAEKNYEDSLAKFHRDPDAIILFGEKPPTDSVDLKYQYDRLRTFAVAWAMHGSKYYHEPAVLSDILFGLEWMYLHMYGEAEIEDRGWRSAHAYDWWHWYVGASEGLTDILFLIEEHVTSEQKSKYLRCFRWVVSFMRQGYCCDSAMSRIRVCTKCALLLEDSEWMENEFYDYDLLTEVNTDGGGPHIDYVEWTHGYPYNLVYGHNNLCRTLFVGAILGGTPVEFTSPKQYNLFNVARYMFGPIHYKGRGAQIFAGRGICAPEYQWGVHTIFQLLPMIGLFGEEEDLCIKRMIKRNSVLPEVVRGAKLACSLPDLKKYVDILNDDSIPYDDGYEIAHAYFTGDRAVQQRNDYAFTVAMASERHPSYESINGANKLGWYTGDGAVYLCTNNDMHTFDGANFGVNAKVMMNIPGTTVDTQERIPWSHRAGIRGACDFVGCMDIDKKYAVAAMDYRAYDFHGETVPPTDADYGGGFLPHTNDLTAKKAYFLLDRECVCLGAGITSTTGYPVKTVVEDRNLIIRDKDTAGADRTAVDGGELPRCDFAERVFDGVHYASLEGVGGYVFLENASVSAEKFSLSDYNTYAEGGIVTPRKHAEPKRFFKLCIEHGKNPKNASYAYAIIPYADDGVLKAYSQAPEVEIISNTSECQAVRKRAIGISSYIFYSAGTCEDITVSEPCIVTLHEHGGAVEVYVCEPTTKLTQLKVTVNRAMELTFANDRTEVFAVGGRTELTVDVTHSVGRPYVSSFSAK